MDQRCATCAFDHLKATDRATKAQREADYWRERCEYLEAAQERFLGWLKNEAFMFGCVAEDIKRQSVTRDNITPEGE